MRRRPEEMAGRYSSSGTGSYGGGAHGVNGASSGYGASGRPPAADNYHSSRDDRGREAAHNLYEQENNRRIAELSSQVSMLKELSIDIGSEVRTQNQLLDDMGKGFGKTEGLMGTTMRRLNMMLHTPSGRHMLWLVAFIVFVFVLVYFIVKTKG